MLYTPTEWRVSIRCNKKWLVKAIISFRKKEEKNCAPTVAVRMFVLYTELRT